MLQQHRPASPHRGTHQEDRGQDSLAAELHSLISIVTVKFEWVWSPSFKLLKLVSGMESKEIHEDLFGVKKAWIRYLLCDSILRALKTWTLMFACSHRRESLLSVLPAHPQTLSMWKMKESFFHHPECLKVTAFLLIFISHWLICNFALSL